MKTKWIIQKNIYTGDLKNIIKYLHELELSYILVDVIPFSKSLDIDINHDGPIIAYGSTTLMKLSSKNWIWYNEDIFKPSIWGYKIGTKYLNSNAKIMKLREVLDNWEHPQRLFIRPNSDFKLFSGDVFMKGDFYDWYKRVKSLIDDGTYVNLNLDTEVSVSEYKKISKEWRFFIVDKQVIAASQYKENGRLKKSIDINIGSFFLASSIAKSEWQLAPAYVVDIALTEDGEYKVIEFNNFNSSGFYKCDIKNILYKASILKEKEFMKNYTCKKCGAFHENVDEYYAYCQYCGEARRGSTVNSLYGYEALKK